MEMKAPTTTAQPQPPSGGVYPWGPPSAGGMSAHEEEDDEDGDEISCSCWRTTGCRGEENPAAGALGSGVKTCGRNRAESRLNQYRSEGQTHKSSFHTSQHFYLICCQLRDELWRKGGMRNERSSTVVKSKHAEKKKKVCNFYEILSAKRCHGEKEHLCRARAACQHTRGRQTFVLFILQTDNQRLNPESFSVNSFLILPV